MSQFWTGRQYYAIQYLAGADEAELATSSGCGRSEVRRWAAAFHVAATQELGAAEARTSRGMLRLLYVTPNPAQAVEAFFCGDSKAQVRERCGLSAYRLDQFRRIFAEFGRRRLSELLGRLEMDDSLTLDQAEAVVGGFLRFGQSDREALPSEKTLRLLSADYLLAGKDGVAGHVKSLLGPYLVAGTGGIRGTLRDGRPGSGATVREVAAGAHDPTSSSWNHVAENFHSAGIAALSEADSADEVLQLLRGLSRVTPSGAERQIRWRGPHETAEEADRALSLLQARETYLAAGRRRVSPECGRLFVISGPSTSGKTTLLNAIRSSPGLRPAILPKFSTRPWRDLDDDVQFETSFNDNDYDFVYPYNDHRYGIRASDIAAALDQGHNAFVIVSPPRIVRAIKQHFGSLAVTVYLHSNRLEKELERIHSDRATVSGTGTAEEHEAALRTRLVNMRVMRRQYVDNIAFYQHVLLNISNVPDLVRQMRGVVSTHRSRSRQAHERPTGRALVFLLCAPPSSGKGVLSRALELMGTRVISNVRKTADRAPRRNDGPEIEAVGEWVDDSERRGLLDDTRFDATYLFNDTRYALRSSSIWEGLAAGRAQIVITNMAALSRFRSLFGPVVVPVYLYTTRTEGEILDYLMSVKRLSRESARRRLHNAQAVYRDYIRHVGEFRHVLLNTGNPDDLADQMFNILDYYAAR